MQTVQYNFQNPGDYTFPPSIEVDNGVARLVSPYSTSNPSIRPAAALNIDMLIGVEVSASVEALDAVKHTVEIAGVEYWWDGSAWVESSGYAQSNTAEEVTAYGQFLEILSHTQTFRLVSYMHSGGEHTPTLTTIYLTVGRFEEDIVEPAKTKIWGFVRDLYGNPVEGVSIKVYLKATAQYGKIIISPEVKRDKSRFNGYFELLLVDNEGMKYFPDQGIGKPFYVFEFKGSGINFKEGRYVPRVVRMEYADLEKVIGG